MYSHGEKNLILGTQNLLSWVKVYGFAIPIALYRLYAILWKKDRNHIFLDSCLVSGLAGCCVLIVLGIYEPYSHIPNIVLCYMPIVYWVQKIFASKCSMILYVLLIMELYNPFVRTLNERVTEMQETMPKIEQVLTIVNEDTQLFIVVPYNPEEITPNSPRDEYELFIERFEAILTFADANHTAFHIDKCEIGNVVPCSNNTVYIAKTEFMENAIVAEAANCRTKQISLRDISRYIIF